MEESKNGKKNNDLVNHPKYYTSHPSGVECIEITRHHCFDIGNCIKYLWRAGLKEDSNLSIINKEIEDLQKTIWYIDDRIKDFPNLTCDETYIDATFEHPSKINLSIITKHYTDNIAVAMNALFRTGLSTKTYASNELIYLNEAKIFINKRIKQLETESQTEHFKKVLEDKGTIPFDPKRSFDERCAIVRATRITNDMSHKERNAILKARYGL